MNYSSRQRRKLDHLFNANQVSQGAKFSVADSANDNQILGAAKRSIFLSMLDDPLGESLPDSRKLFQLCGRSSVNVDSPGGLIRRLS